MECGRAQKPERENCEKHTAKTIHGMGEGIEHLPG
jgi:hypothetical protein